MLPAQWRRVSDKDTCCSQNKLIQGEEKGVIIDGVWICTVCNRVWCGLGKDKYLNHPLETLTDFGEASLKALDEVIRDNSLAFRFTNVLLKIKEKNPQVSWNSDGSRKV